jgi:hypothetical protein
MFNGINPLKYLQQAAKGIPEKFEDLADEDKMMVRWKEVRSTAILDLVITTS